MTKDCKVELPFDFLKGLFEFGLLYNVHHWYFIVKSTQYITFLQLFTALEGLTLKKLTYCSSDWYKMILCTQHTCTRVQDGVRKVSFPTPSKISKNVSLPIRPPTCACMVLSFAFQKNARALFVGMKNLVPLKNL